MKVLFYFIFFSSSKMGCSELSFVEFLHLFCEAKKFFSNIFLARLYFAVMPG